jgi:hypothetical protein
MSYLVEWVVATGAIAIPVCLCIAPIPMVGLVVLVLVVAVAICVLIGLAITAPFLIRGALRRRRQSARSLPVHSAQALARRAV